jgi:nitrogen fixation protein NifU and related proteins
MSDSIVAPNLRDLYQQVIIDHSKNPRNRCCHNPAAVAPNTMAQSSCCQHANHVQEGHNPLCGDHLTLYVNEQGGVIQDICFDGQGCAISTASASLMTDAVKGKSVTEVLQLFREFQELTTGGMGSFVNFHNDGDHHGDDHESVNPSHSRLGKLTVFAGVREFPIRVKCATLPWHTLKAALLGEKQAVTTE